MWVEVKNGASVMLAVAFSLRGDDKYNPDTLIVKEIYTVTF